MIHQLALALAGIFSVVIAQIPSHVNCNYVAMSLNSHASQWSCLQNGVPISENIFQRTFLLNVNIQGKVVQTAVKVATSLTTVDDGRNQMEVKLFQKFDGNPSFTRLVASNNYGPGMASYMLIATEDCAFGTLDYVFRTRWQYGEKSERMMAKFKEILVAVQQLHKENIAHGNLNLEVFGVDAKSKIKFIDLNNAWEVRPDGYGPCSGTMMYEDYQHFWPGNKGFCKMDLKTDIYSLGVILYELMAGPKKYPFPATSRQDLIQRLTLGVYTTPKYMNPQAAEMIAKCLQTSRDNRPTIDDLIAKTDEYLNSEKNLMVNENTFKNTVIPTLTTFKVVRVEVQQANKINQNNIVENKFILRNVVRRLGESKIRKNLGEFGLGRNGFIFAGCGVFLVTSLLIFLVVVTWFRRLRGGETDAKEPKGIDIGSQSAGAGNIITNDIQDVKTSLA